MIFATAPRLRDESLLRLNRRFGMVVPGLMTAYTSVLGRKKGFQPDFNHNFLLRYSSTSVLRIGEEQDCRLSEMLPAAFFSTGLPESL